MWGRFSFRVEPATSSELFQHIPACRKRSVGWADNKTLWVVGIDVLPSSWFRSLRFLHKSIAKHSLYSSFDAISVEEV